MASSWAEPLRYWNLGLAVGTLIVVAVRRVLDRIEEHRGQTGVDDVPRRRE